jgi:putative redox protein
MSVETVRAEWVRDNVFVLYDHFNFPVVKTQPMGVNGADLMPMSVVGCAGWDVMSILRKQREPVSGLRVVAESERDGEAPWAFRRLRVQYQFTGMGLNPEHLRRAIALTEAKYCSTFKTLQQAVEITSDFTMTSASAPPDMPIRAPGASGGGESAGVQAVLDFNAALNAGDVDRIKVKSIFR